MIAPSFRPDGSVLDLANVLPSDIDFAEMAAGLSKIARFNGCNPQAAYSVAQHSVFLADALYAEHGDAELAGVGVLHDGHEYLIGDPTRPSVALFAHFGGAAIYDAVDAAKASLDAPIFIAAGICAGGEIGPKIRDIVRDMDERMLRAEAAALFGPGAVRHLPALRRPAPRLKAAIEPWGAAKAELAFLDRLDRYLGISVRPR